MTCYGKGDSAYATPAGTGTTGGGTWRTALMSGPVTNGEVVDLCNAQKGRLLIQTDGTVHVQVPPPGPNWAAAQCFVSLDGASFGL